MQESSERLIGKIKSDASYLLTGGLGGIGLEVTSWLVRERGARHICLLGRSAPSEKAQERLEALRKEGAEIEVIQGDVGERDDVSRALSLFLKRCLLFEELSTWRESRRRAICMNRIGKAMKTTFSGKVKGAWNLSQLTKSQSLDFFVLYSSAVSANACAGSRSVCCGQFLFRYACV